MATRQTKHEIGYGRFGVHSEALRAPALSPIACWSVERRCSKIFVDEKSGHTKAKPRGNTGKAPEKIVMVGGGAAGVAAAQTLWPEQTETLGAVARHRNLHHLDGTACESKCHPHERPGPRPIDEIVGRSDQEAFVGEFVVESLEHAPQR
jgi:hypothetical protein